MYTGWHCVIEYGSEKANYIYYFIFSLPPPPGVLVKDGTNQGNNRQR